MTNNQLKAQELRQLASLREAQADEARANSVKTRIAAQEAATKLIELIGKGGFGKDKPTYDMLDDAEKARIKTIAESFGVDPNDHATMSQMYGFIMNRVKHGDRSEIFDYIERLQKTISPSNWMGLSFSLRG
jgi:hypothetical protein